MTFSRKTCKPDGGELSILEGHLTCGVQGLLATAYYLENTPSLLVNKARDTLDTTTTSETADGWLGDALNVVTKDLPVTLGASLSKTFASLASARHV